MKIKEITKIDNVQNIFFLKLIVFCTVSFKGYTFNRHYFLKFLKMNLTKRLCKSVVFAWITTNFLFFNYFLFSIIVVISYYISFKSIPQ